MLLAGLAYLLAAALSWRAADVIRPLRPGPSAFFRTRLQRRLWVGVTAVLTLLAIARFSDLSNEATLLGRTTVQAEGWYGARRPWQHDAIVLILAIGTAVILVAAVAARRAGVVAVAAMAATMMLCGFVLIRAVSLHRVDALLAAGHGPVTLSRLCEFGLLLGLAFLALLARYRAVRETG